MDDSYAPEIPVLVEGDVELASVSFANILDDGEALTGTPTITEVTSTDLTLGDKAVSTGALTINGESVAAGEAVQFSVQGQKYATGSYTIRVVVTTDSSPARTKYKYLRFRTVEKL